MHVFLHELVHAMACTVGLEDLNSNEGAIDALGNMLMQFLSTKRGRIQ